MPRFNLTQLVEFAEQQNMSRDTINALESFNFRCKLVNVTPSTNFVYGERLSYLLKFCIDRGLQIEKLTKSDLQDYIKGLIDKVAPITVNGRIIVYKVFYAHLFAENVIAANPMQGIVKIREPKLIKGTLTPADISRVLSTFNRRTFIGSRNFCMILFSFDSMLRVAELLSIKTSSLDVKSGVVKVYGKGRKERQIAFSDTTAKALFSYSRYREKIKGELLFCDRAGNAINYRQAHRIFQRAGDKVGVHFSPHLARHAGATQFARSGGSLAVLQRALGHSSLTVTQRYVHIDDQDIIDAYERHSPAGGIEI